MFRLRRVFLSLRSLQRPKRRAFPRLQRPGERSFRLGEGREPRGWGLSLEGLQNQQGDFLLPGFYYGIDPRTLSLFVGLPEQEPVDCQEVPALMNMYPAYVLTIYEMGTVRLLGADLPGGGNL